MFVHIQFNVLQVKQDFFVKYVIVQIKYYLLQIHAHFDTVIQSKHLNIIGGRGNLGILSKIFIPKRGPRYAFISLNLYLPNY